MDVDAWPRGRKEPVRAGWAGLGTAGPASVSSSMNLTGCSMGT